MWNVTSVVFTVLLVFGSVTTIHAQDAIQRSAPVTVSCGTEIEGEFSSNLQENVYTIEMNAKDKFNVAINPIGRGLSTFLFVTGPTNLIVTTSPTTAGFDQSRVYRYRTEAQPMIDTGILGSNGLYTIRVVNFYNNDGYVSESDTYYDYLIEPTGIGIYTLSIGCTLQDGTEIYPGDNLQTDDPNVTEIPGFGFPGLAPVDFSQALVSSLAVGQPVSATIPPGLDAVISYTLDAQAGQPIDLTFTRTSGNLNLGLVVLNAENQVVFQASLVAANRVNAQLTLPTSGTYTIGVFRIDLLPPAAPEATGFQIEAALG